MINGISAALRRAGLNVLGATDNTLNGARICDVLIERDRPLSAVISIVEGCLTEPEFIAGVINHNATRRVKVTVVLALSSGEPVIVKSRKE